MTKFAASSIEMRKFFFTWFLFFSSIACFAQGVKLISFNDLNQIINQPDGKTKVINFWATWCKPCVDELPSFAKATQEDEYKNADFIFVSLDFVSQNEKVTDKVKELKLQQTVVQLNEKGYDWIDQFDSNWSGAIPYTILILPDGNRVYHYDWFENFAALKNFLDKNLPN